MNSSEKLTERLTRLQRWSERCERVLSKEMEVLEKIFRETLVALETEKKESFESLAVEEARIKSDLDLAGKDFSTKKYQLEREANHQRADVHKLEEEYTLIKTRSEQELTRMNEEKLHLQISYDKQMRALKDLYQEKIRNSTVAKAGLLQEWQTAERKLKEVKSKQSLEIDAFQAESRAKINKLQEESQSKQQGWSMALEAMKKELETYSQEKTAIERKLTDLKGEKEKELESVRVGIAVSREQLEVDKATLIEKAEEDERRCHQEVSDLKNKIDEAERELQLLVQTRETKKKDEEEAFTKEEQALKDAIRVESEKRDYEQKLFEQEKLQKEKEITHLREDYEKKKWEWDNQIRSLMMQKSVHDSEHDAERMRVDREARTTLRGLEAKRDELKQRLSELKNRHNNVSTQSEKESELLQQRWQWRRDRLWTLWQNRLDVLRKERLSLQEQIDGINQKFVFEKKKMEEQESRDVRRIEDLHQFLMKNTEDNKSKLKQKEIQFELEKTRLFAQIKECENLVSDWMDRVRTMQEDISKNNTNLVEQIGYMDRWYREEETETQAFLQTLQNTLDAIDVVLAKMGVKEAA